MDEEQLSGMLTNFKDEIIHEFRHQIGIQGEEFQHKLDLVVEGQQMLVERMDRMEARLEGVEQRLDKVEVKVDAVDMKLNDLAVDLSAHRKDTEAHHGVYRVKEQ